MAKKKYYWLKLKEDFFRQKEIKKLRRIAGGDTYTIIYLKMLLLAMKNENKIYFEGVEENFAEELALELDEDTNNVKMTLSFLQSQSLMELVDEDEYLLPRCKEMVGVESDSAERVRKHRLKKKEEQKALQCNTDVTEGNAKVIEGNTEIEKEIDIDIDIEKEIEVEKEKPKLEPLIFPSPIHKSIYNLVGDVGYRTWFIKSEVSEDDKSISIKANSDFERRIIISKYIPRLQLEFNKRIEVS